MQELIGCKPLDWEGGGRGKAHAFRERNHRRGGRHGVLGIAAAHKGSHPRAHQRRGGVRTKRRHDTGYFRAWDERHVGPGQVLAGTLCQVRVIDARSLHVDQHFSGAGNRRLNLLQMQYLGTADLVYLNCFHRLSPSCEYRSDQAPAGSMPDGAMR